MPMGRLGLLIAAFNCTTGLPVLSSVSLIVTNEEKRSRRYKKFFWGLSIILVAGALLIVVDKFIINFDKLILKVQPTWQIILERIHMIV